MRKHVTCPYCHIGFSHEFSDSGFEKVSQEQEAFARGRLQGLKEMYDAYDNVERTFGWGGLYGDYDAAEKVLEKLRQEYQQPN